MKIFYSFISVGLICGIASIIYDKSKLTPGHITSLFVVIGCFLSVFDLYDLLIEKLGYGMNLPIMSFGNNLLKSAYLGYKKLGICGIFKYMYQSTSLGISSVLIISFLTTIFCKPKD